MDDAKREKVRRSQACARAAITATLQGSVEHDKASIDLAHDELLAVAREGLLLATAQCMAVEISSLLQLIATESGVDPRETWRLWCEAVQLPDAGT